MSGNLIEGGTSLVKNTQFLFQECYGGGTLDNLLEAFGSLVS